MAQQLTDKQRKVFEFICETMREGNAPPTVREIAAHFGYRSPKAVTDHLAAIERKGYIRRRTHKSRNIEVSPEFSPLGIPLVGRIAAGAPTLAIENMSGALRLADVFNAKGETFALQVQGDSMVGAGILDGDYVVVADGARVKDGAIGAVVLGDEATVKRVFFERTRLRLQAENPDYDDIIVAKDSPEVRVCGPVCGVIRRL